MEAVRVLLLAALLLAGFGLIAVPETAMAPGISCSFSFGLSADSSSGASPTPPSGGCTPTP